MKNKYGGPSANHRIQKEVRIIIALFFLCQLIAVYDIYYELLITPKFLGNPVEMVSTQETISVNPLSLYAPKGTFFLLSEMLVFDAKIRRRISNLTMLYNSDNEFKWLADHIIITLYISLLTKTRSDYFFYNMTLREYIDNTSKLQSKILQSDRYLHIDGWVSGWVNDSSFTDKNVTEVITRFIEVDFVLSAFMWRDSNEVFEEISWLVYTLVTMDAVITLLYIFRKQIKKFLNQPTKDIFLIK